MLRSTSKHATDGIDAGTNSSIFFAGDGSVSEYSRDILGFSL